MKSLVEKIVRFLAAEEGPTAVAYATLILLVFLAFLTAVTLFGQSAAGGLASGPDNFQSAAHARP
jgi:Flp pilus assembly pilin Flp